MIADTWTIRRKEWQDLLRQTDSQAVSLAMWPAAPGLAGVALPLFVGEDRVGTRASVAFVLQPGVVILASAKAFAREAERPPPLARPELTYPVIARALCVTPDTVKSHVRRLGLKLGATGRHGVVAAAQQRGLLPTLELRSSAGPTEAPPAP